MNAKIALTVLLACAASDASAAVFYKHVDSQGKVTYTDYPPGTTSGRVETLQIDTSALPTVRLAEPRAETENERIIRRRPVDNTGPVLAARERLDAARAALQAAQDNSVAEDWIYFGGRGRAPRPEYLARLEGLEAQVKAAEAALADEERRIRLGSSFR